MDPLSSPTPSPNSSRPSSPTNDGEDGPETYKSYYVLSSNEKIVLGAKKIGRVDVASRILTTVALVCFVATVALLIIGFLNKVHPLACLHPVGGAVLIFITLYIIDKIRDYIAEKHDIDIKHHDKLKYPKPPKEKKESSDA